MYAWLTSWKRKQGEGMIKILAGIFVILLIVLLVMLIILMATLIYELIPEDLKEAYWNWRNKKK